MGTFVAMATCPHCGAPLSLEPGRSHVICLFCNTGLIVERPAEGGAVAARLRAQAISKEDVERVKQLLVDGKRAEAVALYAQAAGAARDEAERAVDAMFLSAYWALTRHLPINAFGFLLYGVLVASGLGLAAWAATEAPDAPAYFALVALGGLFALWHFVRFLQHLSSTLVLAFGAQGYGRVVRRAVVREMKKDDAYFIVVLFEVTPDDGGPPFLDQETLFVGSASLQKLSPGNVVRVRFGRAREHVFPASPVTVVATTRA